MGMHTDQKYGKSIMMSQEINDRDKAAKMLNISFICVINFLIVFEYCILLIIRYTYSKKRV